MSTVRSFNRETIKIGDDITIVLIRSGNAARISIDAPPSVRILRSEIACAKCRGRGWTPHYGADHDDGGAIRECCSECSGTGET